MRTTTVLFIGWFGPRGMASVVFLIVANDDLHVIGLTTPVIQAVGWTILLSVVLHGLTAGPLAQAYGARIAAVSPPPIEATEADEPHPRRRSLLGD
jgi:NhaP-type Na+/H+ or K+/H+ antiporter